MRRRATHLIPVSCCIQFNELVIVVHWEVEGIYQMGSHVHTYRANHTRSKSMGYSEMLYEEESVRLK